MSNLILHPAQCQVMQSTARFIGAVSGIRGGKTTAGAIWLLSKIDKDRENGLFGDYLIVAPTVKILDQATLPKFKEFFPIDWGEWKEQKSCFELNWFRTGSSVPCRIYVRSTDDPDSIEGMDALAAWMDEVGKMKSQAWINVQGRLSMHKGPCLMTTTPYAVNWFFKDVYKKGLKDSTEHDSDYETIIWASTANPAFPKDEYERAKRTLPKAIFDRRYNGKFTRLEGLVYPEFDYEFHVVESFEIPSNWIRFGGMDFGYSNPNAIVCLAKDPDTNIFYLYKEFYRSETLLKVLSDFLHGAKLSYVLADTQAAQQIAELQKYYGNTNVKTADKQVMVGIERVRTLLIEGRLKIFNTCIHVLDEIESYHYAEPSGDKNVSDKPVQKNNHCMDAIQYAFSRPLAGLYQGLQKSKRNLHRQTRSRRVEVLDSTTGY